MIEIVHKIRPFTFNPGREFKSFIGIAKSPLEKLNISLLSQWLTDHKKRLFQSPYYQVEMGGEENEADDEAADTDESSDVEKDSDDE